MKMNQSVVYIVLLRIYIIDVSGLSIMRGCLYSRSRRYIYPVRTCHLDGWCNRVRDRLELILRTSQDYMLEVGCACFTLPCTPQII